MVLAGFKAVAADLIVQKGVEGRKTVDLKRSALFLGFGAVYMGGVQFIFYVDVLGYLFPRAEQFAAQSWAKKLRDKAGMVAVLNQTALEQCVHTPLCFFPAYYIAKEACLGDASKRCDTNVVEVALGEYRKNFFVDMSADACIWCPAHLFNFAFLPMHLRVPFVSCVSFSYLLVLSWFRGAPADATTTAPATAEARQDAAPEARREASLRPQPVGALRPA
ncbi:hypothetical protein M885DRAFT_435717 [Pelagophyceae sp. CCMP2097]|nr:hypothetical protein M885DRAFT_435717 [Pelagophyceae sp. CCMP2097]